MLNKKIWKSFFANISKTIAATFTSSLDHVTYSVLICVDLCFILSLLSLQGATSHHLGQNFSKMFDIKFEDPNMVSTEPNIFNFLLVFWTCIIVKCFILCCNMWHDQGKWVTCRKLQFLFSCSTFSKLQNASFWCNPITIGYLVTELWRIWQC